MLASNVLQSICDGLLLAMFSSCSFLRGEAKKLGRCSELGRDLLFQFGYKDTDLEIHFELSWRFKFFIMNSSCCCGGFHITKQAPLTSILVLSYFEKTKRRGIFYYIYIYLYIKKKNPFSSK